MSSISDVKFSLILYNSNSGASYADSLRFQRCIDLWRLALQVRVQTYSILYTDTCFTAQALVRLMLDLQDKIIDIEPSDFVERGVPRFDDVLGVFTLLNKNLLGEYIVGDSLIDPIDSNGTFSRCLEFVANPTGL